jgi:hypothetical protein
MKKDYAFPDQCTDLSLTLPDGGQFIFAQNNYLPWTMIGSYIVVYSVPIVWIFSNRKKGSFRTRSPRIITVGLALMMLDSVLNTIWMTRPAVVGTPWVAQCDLSIFITVFVFFSIMVMYFARMWRVYKVFSLYQQFLDLQNAEQEE